MGLRCLVRSHGNIILCKIIIHYAAVSYNLPTPWEDYSPLRVLAIL